MKRKWDVSSKEVRKQCVEQLIAAFDQYKDSTFGVLAAEEVIDIVLRNIGPDIYNLAIKDATKLLESRFADIETDLDLLHHPI